jgi:predicted alpha/beta hydrolase family esterase
MRTSRLSRIFGRLALASLVATALMGAFGAHAAPAEKPHGQPHSDQPHTPHAHVYLLRGLFNVFSLGMDTLAEELSRKGVETSVNNYADWQTLADRAAERYKAGTENPIILIGHSLGADAVIEMAAYLGRRDVPVALVIPFDGTHLLVAPANVARLVNLTQRNYAYARPGPGFKGSLANVDVSSDANIDHINIDKAARTHARAISEVMSVVGHPSPGPKIAQPPAAEKPASASAAPTEETTGATPPPSDASPIKPAPSEAVAPPPAPSAAVTPPASMTTVAPPASPVTVTLPAAEPARVHEESAAPPAAPARPPVQDANSSSAAPEKPPAKPAPAASVSRPAPSKPQTRSSPAIED